MDNEQELNLASVFERLLAFIIDYMPFNIITQALFWYIPNKTSSALDLPFILKIFVISYALFAVYEIIFTSGGRRTLGKFLLGIRVVRKNGEPTNIANAVLRTFGYFVGIILSFLPFALAFVSKNKRAFHDMLAGTLVVTERSKTTMEATVTAAFGTLMLGVMIGMPLYQLKTMTPPQQQIYIKNATEMVEKIGFLEDVHYKQYHFYTSDMNRLALISGDPVRFQRDVQRNIKRTGFKIGIDPLSEKAQNMGKRRPPNAKVPPEKASYQIMAIAKDNKQTKIYYPTK